MSDVIIDGIRLTPDRYRLGMVERPLISDMVEANILNQAWQQRQSAFDGLSYRSIHYAMIFSRETCPQCGNEFINRSPHGQSVSGVCTSCYWVNVDYDFIDGDEDEDEGFDEWDDPEPCFNPEYGWDDIGYPDDLDD